MRTMENLFFELLQVALGIREGLSRKLTVEEWRKVYEEAVRQSLTGVLFCAVERMPKDWRPETDLMMEWYGWTGRDLDKDRADRRLSGKGVLSGKGYNILPPHTLARE